MEKVQKVIDIASQLGLMQEFCESVGTVHAVAKCSESNSEINIFNSKLKKEIFNENLSYNDRRNFFLRHCVKNLNIFWAMYKLQQKGKENLERINQLIKSQEPTNEKEKDEALLAQLVVKRQEVQK